MNPAASQPNAAAPEATPPPVPFSAGVLRWRRALIAAVLALALGIAGWTVWSAEPSGQFFYPRCQFHALTGLQCPGCGATRSVHHLVHGEIGPAIRSNAVLVLFFVPLLGFWGWQGMASRRASYSFNGRWAAGVLALLLVFFVVRNLPGPAHRWLNPPPPASSQP
jgi:hypothetical protein